MTGYKRVNFYELCRLCATNREKKKTHIFEEEGRKMQLQAKIQACLGVKVCETDCLPKVVCSDCLRNLEESFSFRKRCISSEKMLSTYFNNYRHTDDFKKSGQVYIKDVEAKDAHLEMSPLKPVKAEKALTPNINVSVNQNGEVIKISQDRAEVVVNSVTCTVPQSYGLTLPPVESVTDFVDVPFRQTYETGTKAIIPVIAPKADPTETETKLATKVFPCELCTKVFKRREHLYQHVKLHSGFRPFVCEYCKKSFMRKEHLHRHMTCHSGQRNFTCQLCLKAFSRNDNLLKHKKTHDKKAGYGCKICGKQFTIKQCYVAHKCDNVT